MNGTGWGPSREEVSRDQGQSPLSWICGPRSGATRVTRPNSIQTHVRTYVCTQTIDADVDRYIYIYILLSYSSVVIKTKVGSRALRKIGKERGTNMSGSVSSSGLTVTTGRRNCISDWTNESHYCWRVGEVIDRRKSLGSVRRRVRDVPWRDKWREIPAVEVDPPLPSSSYSSLLPFREEVETKAKTKPTFKLHPLNSFL